MRGPRRRGFGVAALDWRTGRIERLEPGSALAFELAPREWAFRILAPLAHGEIAVFGDIRRFACAGDGRIRDLCASAQGAELDVLGAPGERVTLTGWSARLVGLLLLVPVPLVFMIGFGIVGAAPFLLELGGSATGLADGGT